MKKIEIKTIDGMCRHIDVYTEYIRREDTKVYFLVAPNYKEEKCVEFPSIREAQEAYVLLKTGKDVPFTALETYSDPEMLHTIVLEASNLRYMRRCIRLAEYHSRQKFFHLDAFKGLNLRDAEKLYRGALKLHDIDVEFYSYLWGRTLPIPRTVLEVGISPIQFFKHILHGKKS